MGDNDLGQTPARDPGNDFEQMCWGLLRRRYRPEHLQRVPADMGGDCGIEGFSSDGCVYQCYADRDSQTLRHRTDKQKSKLNADTLKLQKQAARLQSVLGDLVIEHYIFLVPEFHAAELVAHAANRAQVVRGYNLAFIGQNFEIRVKTPEDYPAEYNAALRDGAAKAKVPSPEIGDDHVELFAGEKPDLVKALDGKLAVLGQQSQGVDLTSLRDSLIRAFLAKEQVMEALTAWPDTWEAVEQRRGLRQQMLEIESELSPESPNRRVMSLIEGYGDDLISNVAGVGDADAKRLALGQVGEWLMRCPLRFQGTS